MRCRQKSSLTPCDTANPCGSPRKTVPIGLANIATTVSSLSTRIDSRSRMSHLPTAGTARSARPGGPRNASRSGPRSPPTIAGHLPDTGSRTYKMTVPCRSMPRRLIVRLAHPVGRFPRLRRHPEYPRPAAGDRGHGGAKHRHEYSGTRGHTSHTRRPSLRSRSKCLAQLGSVSDLSSLPEATLHQRPRPRSPTWLPASVGGGSDRPVDNEA